MMAHAKPSREQPKQLDINANAASSVDSLRTSFASVQISGNHRPQTKLNPNAPVFSLPLTPSQHPPFTATKKPRSREKPQVPRPPQPPTTKIKPRTATRKPKADEEAKPKRRPHVLHDGSRTVIGQRKKTPPPTTVPVNITYKKPKRKRQIGRRRSNSTGSSGSESDDDEAFPEPSVPMKQSAFTDRLTLTVPQKRIPKRVTREAVVDTVFSALFASNKLPTNDDNTGSDSDAPNESFVKRGLAATLFKDGVQLDFNTSISSSAALDQYITPTLIHSLVTEMRFEDFRTSSARLHILRAIHKHVPARRMHISQALVDATSLRLDYLNALHEQAHALGREVHPKNGSSSSFDHGHGWTEFLRYAVEHIALGGMDAKTILTNYARAWSHLCRAHYLDPQGTDKDELTGVAGQFVAYVPDMAWPLIRRLVGSGWPTRAPSHEIFAIRTLARLLMAAPRGSSKERTTTLKAVFRQLVRCMSAPHVAVAKEALAFAGCQFVLVHYVQDSHEIYTTLSVGFHSTAKSHWNESIRTLASTQFDQILDFAA
ncbi:hypothetical protein AC1031_003136 [Aphanomyces cochlioides]|nr:hypothetical protein AC1031_003136 [Aphanomyces cochlioides]